MQKSGATAPNGPCNKKFEWVHLKFDVLETVILWAFGEANSITTTNRYKTW